MREELLYKCELFIKNCDAMKAAFPMENSYLYPVCASVYSNAGKALDGERMKECRKLMRGAVGMFSNFKGVAELPIAAMISLDPDMSGRIERAVEMHAQLREHFSGSEYLPVAATVLSGLVEPSKYEDLSARTKKQYELMKGEHPFLTSSEDSVFASLLALSDRPDEEIVRECEICYEALREKFNQRNAVQALSHVLALSNDGARSAKDKCRDTMMLFDILKDKGCKYGTGGELATLGALAMLPCTLDEIADDVIAASEYLSEQKGYHGFFGTFDKTQRYMHAAMIVVGEHGESYESINAAAIGGTVALIAAQHAAVCACIAASAAASAAAAASR